MLRKTTSYNLLESDIRYAMSQTTSNSEAARFLRISMETYKKYAQSYIDGPTGKTLYQLHRESQKALALTRRIQYSDAQDKISIYDLMVGAHPEYKHYKLKAKILREGVMKEECRKCGFGEARLTDNKVPLLLVWKDGDKTNHKIDNLDLICHNCFFLNYGAYKDSAEKIKYT